MTCNEPMKQQFGSLCGNCGKSLPHAVERVEADFTIATDLELLAAVRRLAATGKVNERMYLTDATYKALAYRIHRGTPPNDAIEEKK